MNWLLGDMKKNAIISNIFLHSTSDSPTFLQERIVKYQSFKLLQAVLTHLLTG